MDQASWLKGSAVRDLPAEIGRLAAKMETRQQSSTAYVVGLELWVRELCIAKHEGLVTTWVEEMGACDL